MATFAPDERLPSSATLTYGGLCGDQHHGRHGCDDDDVVIKLEICQKKNCTTNFLVQKVYTLKIRVHCNHFCQR